MLQYFWWSFGHFLETIRITIRQHSSLPFNALDRCVSYNRMRILSFLLTLQFIFPWCSSSFVPRTSPSPASCPTSHNAPALRASLAHTLHVLPTVFYNCCTHRTAKDHCRKNRSYCHLHTFGLGCCSCSFKASSYLYLWGCQLSCLFMHSKVAVIERSSAVVPVPLFDSRVSPSLCTHLQWHKYMVPGPCLCSSES